MKINNLSKKQKIVLIIIGIIVLILVGGYGFFLSKTDENVNTIALDDLIDNNIGTNIENNIGENNETSENTVNQENQNTNNIEKLTQEKIIVHITGEVEKTGIITLNKGARIADAIKEAGGETKDANLDEVNLAYELEDGQKIYIPNKNEKSNTKAYITSESGNNVITETRTESLGSKGVNKKVNINTAKLEELENLPGIGPSIANRIIEYREQNGKYSNIEDLKNVKGIGDAKFSKIKEYITV